MVHYSVLCIFERLWGPLNVTGPRVAYPLPHPLNWPDEYEYESGFQFTSERFCE